jgi:hypothetical protein
MTMTTSKGIAFLLALSACGGVANAHDRDRNNCREVRALIVDTSAPVDCPSPYRFCAAGTVEGNRGLNGTTYFVLDGVGTAPVTAPGFNVTTGLLTYTTPEGTLTVRETGMGKLVGNPSNGVLTSLQEIVSGTGKFAGATGTLYNAAVDINGVFYSDITGTLCLVPRKPRD